MLDVAELVNLHELSYVDRLWVTNLKKVVSSQVYKHQVLSSLFFVSQKAVGKFDVFFEGFSTGFRPCNRVHDGLVVEYFYQRFRR